MSISTIGLDELIDDMAALAELPDKVIDDMLNAKADIIEVAQKQRGRAMGVHNTGLTLSSIKRTKSKRNKGGRSLEIYPQGTNSKGVRNAEVAFMNEYGTPGNRNLPSRRFVAKLGVQVSRLGRMPARPFIDSANKAAGQQATDAAAKVLDTFISSKNL